MIMFKDNRITSIPPRRLRPRKVGGFALRLDVEVGDEDEANETTAASADVVTGTLDNTEGSEFASVHAACASTESGRERSL
jgi:nicotinate-nucleotide pyrophosphorylase